MNKIRVALSVLCFLFLTSATFGEEIIYSETFTRGSGAPVTVIEAFSGIPGPATISLTNGGIGGDTGEKAKSFTVTLNGNTIFDSSDFNRNVPDRSRKIVIDWDNELGVLLRGKTGGKIGIEIKQFEMEKLVTPYVDVLDMEEIRNVFNSDHTLSQPDMVHDGIDIYPDGDLKPFRAACAGRVDTIYEFNQQVTLFIACNPTYTIEYNFESQAPDSGETQLDHIEVVEGQTVSQGDIIGYLYDADPDFAHIHFTLRKNSLAICPEPYFDPGAKSSIESLVIFGLDMCYGPDVTPPPLTTPYVNKSHMKEIRAAFSTVDTSPWGFTHDGIDIYPKGDQRAFQAACAGIIDSVELRQAAGGSNWQVDVLIQCDEYVEDPLNGGYFIPFSVDYVFEPMSENPTDGDNQLANIDVIEGQTVSPGDIIGRLDVVGEGAHLQFSVVQFGSSDFQALGITGIPICPEPHFSPEARTSILNLLHAAWPTAGMCYQE